MRSIGCYVEATARRTVSDEPVSRSTVRTSMPSLVVAIRFSALPIALHSVFSQRSLCQSVSIFLARRVLSVDLSLCVLSPFSFPLNISQSFSCSVFSLTICFSVLFRGGPGRTRASFGIPPSFDIFREISISGPQGIDRWRGPAIACTCRVVFPTSQAHLLRARVRVARSHWQTKMVSLCDVDGDDATTTEMRKELAQLALETAQWEGHTTGLQVRTIRYPNGDVYRGEALGDLRHGRGKHTCSTGDVYDGSWREDLREGTGTMRFANGLTYTGEWWQDKTHGQGTCVYPNGDEYHGEWKEDRRWGWGTYDMVHGDTYEGEWCDDLFDGQGRYTFHDGSYYQGEYANNQRIRGTFVSADGKVQYEGTWKKGARHGKGTFHQVGLYKYTGDWSDDQRHGRGTCVYADGSTYEGEWMDDLRHGKGKFTTPSGEVYEGDWHLDLQHGKGQCVLDSGEKYVGEWNQGMRHGLGKCQFTNGDKYEGEWKDGKRHGKGKCYCANGDKYQGHWAHDRRHGYGVCHFHDGTKFRGEWDNGVWLQSSADPEFSKVKGPGISRAIAGENARFFIEARDELRNRRLNGGDEFAVYLLGPNRVQATVKDNEDGTYDVEYKAEVAGQYQLHIMIGADEPVAESPYPVRVLPNKPSPRQCTLGGANYSHAKRHNLSEFSVEAKDKFGNRCFSVEELPVEVRIIAPSGADIPVGVQEKGGKWVVTYTPTVAGYFRIEIHSSGALLGASPYSLLVTEAGALTEDDLQATKEGSMEDRMAVWEAIAKIEYAADGNLDGWDSEKEEEETADDKYARAHPDVPVIENLEDLWKVGKVQKEIKEAKRKEKEKKLQSMKSKLKKKYDASALEFGTGSPCDNEEKVSSIADLD